MTVCALMSEKNACAEEMQQAEDFKWPLVQKQFKFVSIQVLKHNTPLFVSDGLMFLVSASYYILF